MSLTRLVDEKIALLFSVPAVFSEHLTKWEDSLLLDKYDHNAFKYSGQPSIEEFRKAVEYQKMREQDFIKLEGYWPLENSFGIEEEVTLVMMLKVDADIRLWKTNPDIVLKTPNIEQLEQLGVKHYGTLYGESFTTRNIKRLYEKMNYHGTYLGNKLVGYCHTYSTDGYTCIDDLIVDRDYRHQYIATTLIKEIVEAARKNGDQIYLHADLDDTPKEMYAKMGFEEVDRIYEYTCTDFDALKL